MSLEKRAEKPWPDSFTRSPGPTEGTPQIFRCQPCVNCNTELNRFTVNVFGSERAMYMNEPTLSPFEVSGVISTATCLSSDPRTRNSRSWVLGITDGENVTTRLCLCSARKVPSKLEQLHRADKCRHNNANTKSCSYGLSFSNGSFFRQ
jgi:hypothetical protein